MELSVAEDEALARAVDAVVVGFQAAVVYETVVDGVSQACFEAVADVEVRSWVAIYFGYT